MLERKELGLGAYVDYDPDWMSPEDSLALQEQLNNTQDWQQRPIRIFGKEVMQPRLIDWAGEIPYRYSGQTLPPKPVPELLLPLYERVREQFGVPFNHILLNRYRDGKDNMGMHTDSEPELGKDPVIAALSLGVARRFVLEMRSKYRRRRKYRYSLKNGSMLVMGGTCQHTFRHGVPRQASVEEERINITFRYLLRPPPEQKIVGAEE